MLCYFCDHPHDCSVSTADYSYKRSLLVGHDFEGHEALRELGSQVVETYFVDKSFEVEMNLVDLSRERGTC